jgi:4-amino-4-deoxy-L-arabinose transferase-like glycosyltransferase
MSCPSTACYDPGLDSKPQGPRFLLAAILLYLLLAIATALTARPWCDEAWFADPAFSLIHTGQFATPVLEPTGNYRHPTGIQQYTYWIMPLHGLVQAPWYEIFGFGFPSLRLLSVLWGLLGLAAVFELVRRLSGNAAIAAIAVALLACDFIYIGTAGTGRMDMMCAALVFGGLALYARYRESAPRRAIFAGHALIAAAAFTHPIGGMIGFVALMVLMLPEVLHQKRDLILFGVPPYLIFAAGWAIYISRRPDYFAAQFFSNSEGRFTDLLNPIRMVTREISERYVFAYGGFSKAGLIKLYVLALYVACGALLLASGKLRRRLGAPKLLAVCITCVVALMLLDSSRQSYYLIYAVIPLAILTAGCLWTAWQEYTRLRVPMVAALILLAGIQIATVGSRIRTNPMGRGLQPLVTFLRQRYPVQRIDGSAEIGMALGFPANFVDDPSLGYYTHRPPDAFIVEEVGYQQFFIGFCRNQPEVCRYVTDLRDHYTRVYDAGGYTVYARQ